MKETTNKFFYSIYNQETGEIFFIHIGAPSLTERIKHECKHYKNKKLYAFKPRSIEEFLYFTKHTDLISTRNYGQKEFIAYRVQPSKNIKDEISFSMLASLFANKHLNSPEEVHKFIRQCNAIKNDKLNPKNTQTERE